MVTKVDSLEISSKDSRGNFTGAPESGNVNYSELLPIENMNGRRLVDLRRLHKALGVKSRFNDWINDRLSKYGFLYGEDYVTIEFDYTGAVLEKEYSDSKQVRRRDYFATTDMAKHLCMVENNEVGMKIRKYFIGCERVLIESMINNSNPDSREIELLNAKARWLESRTKASEMFLNISKTALTDTYAQVAEAYAINMLAGKDVVALPETTEIHMTAKEIGDMFGVSNTMIGRIANKYGLKTPEYGKIYHDKSKYSSKEVESFRYNKHSIDKFRELLIKEGKIKE